jgi:membrane-associated protein
MNSLIDLFLHLDVHLNDLATQLGPWLYGLLFLIIFCETGLVVTPFLPGDSLLFAVGALAANPESSLSLPLLLILLIVAAFVGDAANYAIGAMFGNFIKRFVNKKHLTRTHNFYEKYGGKTIIIARFIPIIRTFAPFVAGIGAMSYRRFAAYNVIGGVVWVTCFLCGGYALANVPTVKRNFHVIILAIIVISVMPAVIEFFLAWRRGERLEATVPPSSTPEPVESKVEGRLSRDQAEPAASPPVPS